mmetsp:Transcript_38820/g.120748  ORF Transcript_38820/g.120748 Transcript_38820/m.120748 type:complete len:224 (-) Transcript_38820:635-1306(-)
MATRPSSTGAPEGASTRKRSTPSSAAASVASSTSSMRTFTSWPKCTAGSDSTQIASTRGVPWTKAAAFTAASEPAMALSVNAAIAAMSATTMASSPGLLAAGATANTLVTQRRVFNTALSWPFSRINFCTTAPCVASCCTQAHTSAAMDMSKMDSADCRVPRAWATMARSASTPSWKARMVRTCSSSRVIRRKNCTHSAQSVASVLPSATSAVHGEPPAAWRI